MPELDIKARSASDTPPPGARTTLEVAKLIDVSRCIGCKACQSACMEWNELRDEIGQQTGSYTNPADLSDQSWTLMRFFERETGPNGDLEWLIVKDGCMHCEDPGCLRACPAPGAIVQYSNGIVDFQEEHCIGCGYCLTGCPFDIPRYSKQDKKAYKCTLCSDRVAVGLEPACIKACPTQALSFGSKADMVEQARERLGDLRERGFERAEVYDPPGVGGTHVIYVLPRGDQPEAYGLPASPQVSGAIRALRSVAARAVGVGTMIAVAAAAFVHYVRVGRLEVPDDEEAKG
jgi:formate dehydrogenase iron-sulfur subunit